MRTCLQSYGVKAVAIILTSECLTILVSSYVLFCCDMFDKN